MIKVQPKHCTTELVVKVLSKHTFTLDGASNINERKLVDYIVKRVDQLEDNHVTRCRGRPRKTIIETITKY
ncbi:hypothetical protein MTR_1g012510 [Medicago truncatula]|uniref:Uncharacterized protein n=1 Tax=Medicago truncatula TaxID=3880 RepID=G7I705_MEDTR|nr:hypothetical protein MTR_1g012510 [Medicago truncatula]